MNPGVIASLDPLSSQTLEVGFCFSSAKIFLEFRTLECSAFLGAIASEARPFWNAQSAKFMRQ